MNTLIRRLIDRARRIPSPSAKMFVMGVQIENGGWSKAMQYVARRSWLKRRINWSEVDERGWFKEDTDLSLAEGYPLLLTVHNAPLAAREDVSRPCGAIRQECWSDYAGFVIEVIDRYSIGRKQLWVELWNEPDITASPYPDLFGCWPGDGKAYGKMAEKIYKIVKKARPNVMIFSGALAQVGTFATHLPRCDGVSFHSYPKLGGGTIAFASTRLKYEQLRAMGHRNILLSETSVLGDGSKAHGELQALYFDFLLGLKGKLAGAFWYTLAHNGWEHSDMIEKEPKPVWYRYMEALS